jgi:hypothetical protein
MAFLELALLSSLFVIYSGTNILVLLFSLLSFLKEKCGLMRSPHYLCVCLSPLSTFEIVGIFYEIHEGGHALEGNLDAKGGRALEGDLDAMVFNAVAATIPKWQTFKLLRWFQNFHQ